MFVLSNDRRDHFVNREGSATPHLKDAQVFYDITGAIRWMTSKGLSPQDWLVQEVEIKLRRDGS